MVLLLTPVEVLQGGSVAFQRLLDLAAVEGTAETVVRGEEFLVGPPTYAAAEFLPFALLPVPSLLEALDLGAEFLDALL
ncbi:hypothetical protein [Nocardiopsis alborubida]|uniref:Uncharacterized protein n=1 Tax=Nocardiopsis alborubida TaxID=146802 RepID=A0A7X6MHB7_9ACTN|nr:hypothetical protein [Nocardiopsis alborubida]NKZ01332.1 hypothetical protein [Nocardiopsis alborubida]